MEENSIFKSFTAQNGNMRRLLEKIERFVLEGIPFPSTRGYAYIAKKSPFLRDGYSEVARRVSRKLAKGRILDVGTGPGYLPIEIARLIDDVEVIGIDVSEDTVRIASKNSRKEGLESKVRFVVEDANSMPYDDSSFDLVLSTGSFHHWKKPIRVLNEIYRVLKPGCEAWIYDLRKDAPAEDREKLKERYGRFMGLLIYRLVTIHSGTTREELERVFMEPENRFKAYEIREDFPFILEAVLSKM